jgi:hypothetical protein
MTTTHAEAIGTVRWQEREANAPPATASIAPTTANEPTRPLGFWRRRMDGRSLRRRHHLDRSECAADDVVIASK